MATTINYSHGDPVARFFSAVLNYETVHDLFSTVSIVSCMSACERMVIVEAGSVLTNTFYAVMHASQDLFQIRSHKHLFFLYRTL